MNRNDCETCIYAHRRSGHGRYPDEYWCDHDLAYFWGERGYDEENEAELPCWAYREAREEE